MKKQKTFRRRKYLIAPKFQFKYVGYIIGFIYLGALIAGCTVYYTLWNTLGNKLALVYPTDRLLDLFNNTKAVLAIRLLAITPIFIILGIRLSHRIAGPIYRMDKYIDALIRGDYSIGLTLRKHDELKPLAQKLDTLCAHLKEEQESREKAVDELLEDLKKESVSDSLKHEIDEKLKEITNTKN
ncbi:methyl-accepting chemotaxis [Candidatus Omnitrophus magneticus]|uniref:Methyl-accepting chemotaxis n=1 Tax=Candidatus Omnitrophus magneticus TaxID=1609969 RepID=A0A0F0CQR6_9BACT|nr:methyl-accepting chemotaxis [Candidatus Omnitrophus magneticus]